MPRRESFFPVRNSSSLAEIRRTLPVMGGNFVITRGRRFIVATGLLLSVIAVTPPGPKPTLTVESKER